MLTFATQRGRAAGCGGIEADRQRHPTHAPDRDPRRGLDPARRRRKRSLLQRLHAGMHRKDLLRRKATPRVRPGFPRVPRPGCRHGGRALHPYRDAIIRRRIRAPAGTGRNREHAHSENAKLTPQPSARGPRVAATCRESVTVCIKVVLKASLPSISRGCYILVRTCDLHLSLHLRNLIMPCPCCPFDSSTVTRDGGRGTDTRLML